MGKKKSALSMKKRESEEGRGVPTPPSFLDTKKHLFSGVALSALVLARACVVVRESSLFREQTESVF